MDRNHPLSWVASAVAPRTLKRSALFAGGAVAGIAVSAVASYGLVSLFTPPSPVEIAQPAPISSAPAPRPHARPMARIASVEISPLPLVLASATPADIASAAPLAPAVMNTPVAEPAIARTIPVPDQPTLSVETDIPAPVVVSYSRPEITPPTRPEAGMIANPEALAEDIAAALPTRALTAPPNRPAVNRALSTEDFAALAASDATARADAALFATREDETVVAAATGVIANDAWPEIPGIRPRTRPAVPDAFRVAAPAPAAAPSTAAPQEQAIAPRRASGSTCGTQLTRAMPRRSGGAASGSQFFAGLMNVSSSDRDNQVINELARGNMPEFLRHLVPVTFQGTDARGAQAEITICVTPDYLALGSDRDFVRTPLGLPAAASIAGHFDMTLPTPRMVDAIYAQADVRLSPKPMQAGPQMTSTNYLLQHNATIQAQLQGRGGLIAGQKKDVVMASRMASHPGRVAIYGWHRSGGNPIQPVSTVHQASYADYSHGIRLVSKTAYLNGKPVALDDLLASNRYAWLINSDGPMPGPVIRIASR